MASAAPAGGVLSTLTPTTFAVLEWPTSSVARTEIAYPGEPSWLAGSNVHSNVQSVVPSASSHVSSGLHAEPVQ